MTDESAPITKMQMIKTSLRVTPTILKLGMLATIAVSLDRINDGLAKIVEWADKRGTDIANSPKLNEAVEITNRFLDEL